jgi:hypothetical protein
MKTVINRLIPFEGFVAITIWPFVFVRKDELDRFDSVAANHEDIHGEQQKEMLAAGALLGGLMVMLTGSLWWLLLVPVYFWWYLTEYALRSMFGTGNAYRNISFEREAYANEADMCYTKDRQAFAWILYMSRR